MQIKISSPEGIVFEGNIDKITIPTENGANTILPNHAPLITNIQPGIVKIRSDTLPQEEKTFDFIENENTLLLSISKGMFFTDGSKISLVVNDATTSSDHSTQELSEMKVATEQKIVSLREQGSIEEVQRQITKLQKIKADMELYHTKSAQHSPK